MVQARPTVVLDVSQPPPARTMPTRFLPTSAGMDADSGQPQADGSVWQAMIDALVFN